MSSRKPAKTTSKESTARPAKVVLEGFGSLSSCLYDIERHAAPAPSAINFISIHRVRITIEDIEESDEVLGARLVELWENTPLNHHHHGSFTRLAEKYGVELKHERWGINAKKHGS
jgi:hypothetical protein